MITLASVSCADRAMPPAGAPEASTPSHAAADPSEIRSVDAALFVVGDRNAPNESERLMADRLREHHDLSVHLIDDDHVVAADADEVAVVFISKTGESEKTGAMFRDATTPVVFWEDNLQRSDFLGTSHDNGLESTAWHGTEQRIEVVAAAGVARTGGLSGRIDLLETGGQEIVHAPPGALVEDATVVATWPGEPGRPTTYTLEPGDVLASGAATPGARVFLPYYDDTFRYSTPDGLRLFDALIAWVLAP